jgi:hypothetical protein
LNTIGTRRETSLHRVLKFRYAGAEGRIEAKIGGFVADGISPEGELIEVQTGSFGPLRKKMKEFAARGKARIIYPVAVTKYIEVYEPPAGGKRGPRGPLKRLYRRKSPLKGSPWNLFQALLYAPELARLPGLCIEIALVDITEKRIRDGKGSWRRKGVSIMDREISAWHENIRLESAADYLRFAPFKEGEEFTTALLAERTGIKQYLAQKALYVLTKIEVVRRVGKKGRAWVYTIAPRLRGSVS